MNLYTTNFVKWTVHVWYGINSSYEDVYEWHDDHMDIARNSSSALATHHPAALFVAAREDASRDGRLCDA
eukprot:5400970-Pleurochrysis_carterae.AAC.1